MKIDTTFLSRCILVLEKSLVLLQQQQPDSVDYDMYRSAVIKEFEIILEQSHKLLKKVLNLYLSSKKAVDQLTFKDVFRSAGTHDLLGIEAVQRWCEYRDNRNSTAHDYGFDLAEKTLPLMSQFIADAKQLVDIIKRQNAIEK